MGLMAALSARGQRWYQMQKNLFSSEKKKIPGLHLEQAAHLSGDETI